MLCAVSGRLDRMKSLHTGAGTADSPSQGTGKARNGLRDPRSTLGTLLSAGPSSPASALILCMLQLLDAPEPPV
jgi:hypothetical protein